MPPRKTKRSATAGKARKGASQVSSLTLSDLEQIRVLADPLRLRILEELCTEERTTKQVAQRLGEKPTKLYHHVEALERVGLISLSRTRQNRGTVEKYYLAVARSFRADSRVFQRKDADGDSEGAAVLRQMLSTIFDTTSAEVASLIDQGEDAAKSIEEEGVVSFLEVRASKEQLKGIRDKLQELIRSLSGENDADTVEERYRLTIAYYPLAGVKNSPPR